MRRLLASSASTLLAAVLLASCGSEGEAEHLLAPRGGLGDFAGYVWSGKVTSIGSSWRVPRIRGGPPRAVAATWIGVQGEGPAFIQIGTSEQHLGDRASAGVGYFAFWSDPEHGFRPVCLFGVQPGDEIAAQLDLRSDRWRLTIVDSTSGASSRFSTRQQAGSSFGLALWLQEDVTNERTGVRFSYPHLGAVRFQRLAVDSRAPRSKALHTELMSLPGRYLGPSKLDADSFAVRRRPLGARAATFTRIAGNEEVATERFHAHLLSFQATTPRARIAGACAALSRELQRSIEALKATRWPVKARAPIEVMTRTLRLLRLHARDAPRPYELLGWRINFEVEAISVSEASTNVQHALDLPILRGFALQ
jgi:hypothetical protein